MLPTTFLREPETAVADTLPETNSKFAPVNRPKLNQKEMNHLNQPLIFRNYVYVSFSEGLPFYKYNHHGNWVAYPPPNIPLSNKGFCLMLVWNHQHETSSHFSGEFTNVKPIFWILFGWCTILVIWWQSHAGHTRCLHLRDSTPWLGRFHWNHEESHPLYNIFMHHFLWLILALLYPY